MSRVNDPTASADQVKDKATETTQNLRDLGGQAKDVATQKMGDLKDQATQKYSDIKDQATQKYGDLKDQATEYYNQSRQAAQDWEQSLETYVQEKPLQAVAIAAGVGLLFGLLWKRS